MTDDSVKSEPPPSVASSAAATPSPSVSTPGPQSVPPQTTPPQPIFPENQAVLRLLSDNIHIIATINDLQKQNGPPNEIARYQELLHRNLNFIAREVDPALLAELDDGMQHGAYPPRMPNGMPMHPAHPHHYGPPPPPGMMRNGIVQQHNEGGQPFILQQGGPPPQGMYGPPPGRM